jgi:hypothetical protein
MPGVPPVPIPNTVVKPRAANGSRTLGPARVGCCQVYGPSVAKAALGPLYFVGTETSGADLDCPCRLDLRNGRCGLICRDGNHRDILNCLRTYGHEVAGQTLTEFRPYIGCYADAFCEVQFPVRRGVSK